MANKETENCEKFKTMIGGQALIEGIMMRGPEKDAIVIRGKDGLTVEVSPRKLNPPDSWKNWPFIRGIFNFFDAQIVGVKALLRSADLAPDEMQEEPSKFDKWLEKKLGSEAFQKAIVGIAVAMGLLLSIGLFFLLPMVIGGFFDKIITSTLLLNLVEGVIRMVIFMAYMILVSKMPDMRRVFSYHGAEHKTIRCYEARLPLTAKNDPAAPPVRHQLPSGGHGDLHSCVFHRVVSAAGDLPRIGNHPRHLRLSDADDRLQAAAPAGGGGHHLRDQPLVRKKRQRFYPGAFCAGHVDAAFYHQRAGRLHD